MMRNAELSDAELSNPELSNAEYCNRHCLAMLKNVLKTHEKMFYSKRGLKGTNMEKGDS